MANDFLIDPATGDWALQSGTKVNLCTSVEDLTRQRLAITLRTYLGEWFADRNFGLPYLQTFTGKNTKSAANATIRTAILSVDGVIEILTYTSTVDKKTRKLSVRFTVLTESGVLPEQEIDL